MKKAHNLSDVVAKFEEEQAKVSLKKKGQLLEQPITQTGGGKHYSRPRPG